MSHFTVLVITDDPNNLEKLMAPYQENNMGDCPKEYLKFNDEEQYYLDGYETNTNNMVKLADGTLIDRYDDRCYVETEPRRKTWQLPEGAEEVKVPVKEIYASAQEYVEKECDYQVDPETGKRGYWENPNRKWDWYQVGGRWSGMLLGKDGNRMDVAQIKDAFFIEAQEGVSDPIEDLIQAASGEEPQTIAGYKVPNELAATFNKIVADATKEWDDVMSGRGFYRPEYLTQRYGDLDGYIKSSLLFSTFAVITPDGKWHEKGEMGWFGMSSDTPEEAKQFEEGFYEGFIKPQPPENYLIVVDCHI